jgi:hypothetical protein
MLFCNKERRNYTFDHGFYCGLTKMKLKYLSRQTLENQYQR